MRLMLTSKKKAQSLIEYALILAMVAVVAIAALQLLGNNIGATLRSAADTVGEGAENAGKNACEAMNTGSDDDGGGTFTWDDTTKSCVYSKANN